MKKPLIPLFLVVLAQTCAMAQNPQPFTAQVGFQSWTVPATGWYDLKVSGAQGGSAGNHLGGMGATIETSVRLVQGEQLEIVVGTKGAGGSTAGTNNPSGGGGGGYSSIIKKSNQGNIRLVIAGGGGGAGSSYNGDGGRADNWAPTFGAPATDGDGGVVTGGKFSGAGGGGYFADGSWAYDGGTNQTAAGGKSYTSTNGPSGGSTAVYTTSNNLHAGGAGGWGGGGQGGAATGSNDGAGAGGGGYSGGGGGPNSGNGGAGGGSWVPEDNTIPGARQEIGQPIDANVKAKTTSRFSGAHVGDGSVTITFQRVSFQPVAVATIDTSTAVFKDAFTFPGDVSRVKLTGNSTSASDYIQLTPATANQKGTLVINTLPAQQQVSRLVAKFEVQLTDGSTKPADGFSFNFCPNLTTATAMTHAGAAHGLSVTFDSFDNGSGDTAPAVEVVYEAAVKGGVSLYGIRSSDRPYEYSVVEDSSGNSLPMTTDYSGYTSGWVPVEVELVGDATGASKVNVTWNGLRILENVSVPYAPSKSEGWGIGFGGDTGGQYQAQRVRNISLAAWTNVSVSVTSKFGQNLVSPPVGSTTYQTGSSPVFTAPQYVYLDRYGKALSGTEDEMRLRAAYRATRLGGTINGQPLQNGAAVKLTQDSVVNWDWQLDYLAEVNTGTESIQTADGKGISASSVTDATNQGTLGRNWRPLNYNFNSVVFSEIMPTGAGLDLKFQPRGYVIENAPNAPERFLQLSGGIFGAQDHLRTDTAAASGMIGGDGSFTIEFWARRDPVTMTDDQNVVALGSETSAFKQLRVGFTSENAFFITNNAVRYTLPAGLTDDSWHHWAVVNDKTASIPSIIFYRDGKAIKPTQANPVPLSFSGSTATVTIGARANGPADANVEGFFPGGINNVRVWKTALNMADVRSYLATRVVGAGNSSLGLELPFDTLPNVDTAGVYLERRKGTAKPSSVADTALFPVESRTTPPDFSLPATTTVQPASSAGYYGWTLRSRLTIDKGKAGTYTFQVNDGDGFQLFIDGTRVGDTDTPTLVATRALDDGEHVIEFQAYETGSATRRPTILYSSADAGIPSMTAIPSSNLHLLARDLFTMRTMTVGSTESLTGVSFTLHGAEPLFAAPATADQMVASMMPGFHYNAVPSNSGTTQNIDRAEQGSISNYRRVFWMWDKTFHYTVDVNAIGLPDGALNALAQLPFFRRVDGFDDSTNTIQTQTAAGVLRVLDKWLAEGEQLELGHLHRTPDQRYTFMSVSNALNNFANVNLKALKQVFYNSKLARSVTITATSGPGSLMLGGAREPHYAYLAIGEGLNFSSTAAMNTPLNFVLPTDFNPAKIVQTVNYSSDNSDGQPASNEESQWDIVGQKWYPLKPGTYTINWNDQNAAKDYCTIIVKVDFPHVTQTNVDPYYDANHTNIGPRDVQYAGTASDFPATPDAHYRYQISPNPASPFPVDLDSSATDRWTYLRMANSEDDDAKVTDADAGPRFTAAASDKRTVLVFSYREDGGVASGDLKKEKIAVRVVKAITGGDVAANATVGSQIIDSTYDTAGFKTGYIVYEGSNYNGSIYDRNAAVGKWGPIYPVNWHGLFTDDNKRLSIGYYEDPGTTTPGTLHPPVGWPHRIANYDSVEFPVADDESVPVIYIASQLGSEGVNQSQTDPQPQLVLDPAKYTNLTVYNQPNRDLPGFNPNEEHALVAPSNLAAMTGDNSKNIGQSAFFALQQKINRTDRTAPGTYTSEPFVLGQYTDATTGQTGMFIYRVLTTRNGAAAFPARDTSTHLPVDADGSPVPQPANPRYEFNTVIFAGDLVTPIYPLNLVLGGRILNQSGGGNVRVRTDPNDTSKFVDQQTLWHDKNKVPWTVAGDFEVGGQRYPGRFFYRYWYPLAQGFWLGEGTDAKAAGTPVCWLPEVNNLTDFTDVSRQAKKIDYFSYWKENYPALKRGETLAYAGGESKADHPAAPGLPGVIGWASAEVAFDSATRDMVINDGNMKSYNARFMRLLDIHAVDYAKEAMPEDLSPAETDKVSVSGSRWYFKELGARLNQRFYYDSLAAKLVLRGTMNGMESGDPKLTQTPLTAPQLLSNVLDEKDVAALKDLSGDTEWTNAITELEELNADNMTGLVNQPLQIQFYDDAGLSVRIVTSKYRSASSLGLGTTLVPNPESLTEAVGEEKFVTVVENNDPAASGAVTLHVIRLGDERYRGSIAVITPKDAFDEKVELMHTGDFGGNTSEVYYQWWVHDAALLDGLLTPDQSTTGWTIYQQGKGLTSISFAGDPKMTLADKLFYVRYGHASELGDVKNQTNTITSDPQTASITPESWRFVDPDANTPDWGRSNPDGNLPPSSPDGGAVPYQWAGAANSPQLQASGARRFLPQLLMGWVKRVLDAVNPYEARYSADFNGDSPATYTSMLVQAGRPYNGPVALNSAKDVIENVGLIELYETVLQRAKDLSGTTNDPGINQAMLLASTRLATLYELLAGEAYTDAINPSIALTGVGDINPSLDVADLSAANPYIFAFMNEVPNLLQEELALLRGTDYLKSYPCQNRLFWNYFKGIGEAAYNANYGIHDVNKNGLIDESDAATLYPMGHGDAWGHFLSASKMHYGLLQRSNYDWQARTELYSLLGNVIPTDYLDEQSFARTTAAKARCGLSIVKATYRDAYNADPATQWQGYTDSADPARAWGMSEWACRAGQGAAFDWMLGNAILPVGSTDQATGKPLEGLNLINRQTAGTDLLALAGILQEIQQALASFNGGLTPIGVDPDTVSFGLDAFYDGSSWERKTHFQQTYESAVAAAANARAALDFVSSTSQTLRQIADDTSDLQQRAVEQDIDYRNRLIGLFGTPYTGTIGAGQIFPDGYSGPDLLTYMYVDAATVHRLEPHPATSFSALELVVGTNLQKPDFSFNEGMPNKTGSELFEQYYLTIDRGDVSAEIRKTIEVPYAEASAYGFQADETWGARGSTGEIQLAIGDVLKAEVDFESALDEYQVYIDKLTNLVNYTDNRIDSLVGAKTSGSTYNEAIRIIKRVQNWLKIFGIKTAKAQQTIRGAFRTAREIGNVNLTITGGNLPSKPVVGGLSLGFEISERAVAALEFTGELKNLAAEEALLNLEKKKGQDEGAYERFNTINELLKELSNELTDEPGKRLTIADAVLALNQAGAKVRSLEAEGNRLISERAAANKSIAARAQSGRYGDMVARLSRDDAARKYESAMDTALRFAWLAAKAYDYETSLSPGHPANAVNLMEDLMKVRQLGQWDGETPKVGNGGLAEVLAKLKANYDFLGSNIGLNNPQWETSTFSLRTEAMRIKADGSSTSNQKWQSYLASTKVTDLNTDADFAHYCRPFVSLSGPAQLGFKIEFSTEINSGKNFFGKSLSALDHAYSSANFATKIRSVGVGLSDYDVSPDGKQKLSGTPRVYLVPAGLDIMRYSDGLDPKTRGWNVVAQRLPVPFQINNDNLRNYAFNPAVDGLNGRFADLARLGDFRAYPTSGGTLNGGDPAYADTQLFSRSVWNTKWFLFIPAASLGGDQQAAMQRFIDTVTDIQVQLTTFSSYGM